MLAPKLVVLNEGPCPIDEKELSDFNTNSPKDSVQIAANLPPMERARLSQFCYSKAHLHDLALRIASTCDLWTLESVFGRAGKIVFEQSRDIDSTLAKLNRNDREYEKKPVSLPKVG